VITQGVDELGAQRVLVLWAVQGDGGYTVWQRRWPSLGISGVTPIVGYLP
jgi:hypothetical protein